MTGTVLLHPRSLATTGTGTGPLDRVPAGSGTGLHTGGAEEGEGGGATGPAQGLGVRLAAL